MASTETNGDNRPYNKPGLYRHKETGVEVVTRDDHGLGSAMADAFVQVGYVYVGPAPTETKATAPATKVEAIADLPAAKTVEEFAEETVKADAVIVSKTDKK